MSETQINSREYWSARFLGDWEEKQGREQTRFFARLALTNFDLGVAADIRTHRLSICDWGCALGDAVPLLAEAFPGSVVAGVDFSEEAVAKARALFPNHAFHCAGAIGEIGQHFDVLFTSNTLEHLENPLEYLGQLADAARRYVVVLVPFLETERIAEHVVTFDFDFFPLRVGAHNLIYSKVLDLRRTQPTYWPGRQILLVYVKEGTVDLSKIRLAAVAADPAPELEARLAEQQELLFRRQREVAALLAKVAEQDALVASQKEEAQQWRAKAAEFEYQASCRQQALDGIQGSLAWKVVRNYRAFRDKVMPGKTGRRRAYDLATMVAKSPRQFVGRIKRLGGRGALEADAGPLAELARFQQQALVRDAKSVAVLFSSVKLIENEGQRPTQLALEFSKNGTAVVFLYWRWRQTEWCQQDRLGEGILQLPIDLVTRHPESLFRAFEGKERLAFFEFPHPSFFECLAAANANGWITVYDVLDDWEEFHRVGQAVWWEDSFERHLSFSADAVFAVNETLANRVRNLGGESVEVVANGLRREIAAVDRPRPLARGEVTVGYFGYLSGAWFDWQLVAAAGRARPAWRFYLIGYGGSPEGVGLPDNVVLLGKKPFSELASFAANWDVAFIPFKPEKLAAGADPIKTYEYLALGLPVVVTGVYPPPGSDGLVLRAGGLDDLLEKLAVSAAGRPDLVPARQAYAASCAWSRRLDAMLESLRRGRQRVGIKQAIFAER